MGFIIVRKATPEDYKRMQAAGLTFLAKHTDDSAIMRGAACDYRDGDDAARTAADATQDHDANFPDGPRLTRMWSACARRALRASRADTIAWQSVGYSVR